MELPFFIFKLFKKKIEQSTVKLRAFRLTFTVNLHVLFASNSGPKIIFVHSTLNDTLYMMNIEAS